jgi:hypothetical protein
MAKNINMAEMTETGNYKVDVSGCDYIRFQVNFCNAPNTISLSYKLGALPIVPFSVSGTVYRSEVINYTFPYLNYYLTNASGANIKCPYLSFKNLSKYSVVDIEIGSVAQKYRLGQGEALNLNIPGGIGAVVVRPVVGNGQLQICYGDNPINLQSSNYERLAQLDSFPDTYILAVNEFVILKANANSQVLFSTDNGSTWSAAITLTSIDNTFMLSGHVLNNGNCIVCAELKTFGNTPDTTNRKTFHINTSNSVVTPVQFFKNDGVTPIESNKQSGGWFVSGVDEKPWMDFGTQTGLPIIFGNYTTNGADHASRTDPVRLYKSVDGGLTFRVVYDWNDNILNSGNYNVRHVHTVKWIGGSTWWAFTGDGNNESNWYKSTNDGDSWTWVCGGSQRYRLIGVYFLSDNDSVIWACDSDNGSIGIYKSTIADLADETKHQLLLSSIAEFWGLEGFGNTLLAWSVGIRGNIYRSDNLGQSWKPVIDWSRKTTTISKRTGFTYCYGHDRFGYLYIRTNNLDETARIIKIKI